MKNKFYKSRLSIGGFTIRKAFIFILLAACITQVSAQNFRLVKDINTSTDGNPRNYNFNYLSTIARSQYAVLNGVSYFGADDGVHGRGLWRSDGTEAGTYQVKDNINPDNIVASNGKLFFSGIGNPGLWTSDGTEAGTRPVLTQIPAGFSSFNPTALIDYNGSLFFVVGSNGSELWKSDGTSTGTVLVKNFYSSNYQLTASGLMNFAVVKNRLYFTAYSSYPSFAQILCTSDGTTDGTYVISKNLGDPRQIIAAPSSGADSLVYFTANNINNRNIRTLYVTNGNLGNAEVAPGFNGFTTTNNPYQRHLSVIGSTIYFIGRLDLADKSESLYKHEIKALNGIQPVKIVTGSTSSGRYSSVSNLTNIDSTLYFGIYDATNNKQQFWKSNGSSNGNLLLKDSIGAGDLVKGDHIIYFQGYDVLKGSELWKTDGTVDGTSIVKDINPKTNRSSSVSYLTFFNNILVFSANDGENGYELWKSDGTELGTVLLKDINQSATASSSISRSTSFNSKLVFTSHTDGTRIFTSDGTAGGTKVLNDTTPGRVPYYNTNNRLKNFFYYFGYSSVGNVLYKTNGTSEGTIRVKNLGFGHTVIDKLEASDSLVYFFITNTRNEWELWRSDGTEANTYIIKNDFNSFQSSPGDFAAVGRELFFVAPGGGGLWKTNGTAQGTVMLKGFPNGAHNFKAYNGKLYFSANDGSFTGLWRSDGTVNGTYRVTDKVSYPGNLTSSNGQLFFTATGIGGGVYGQVGTELFKTNGTESGTVLVRDIEPGINNSNISMPVTLMDTLYFFRRNLNPGNIELWKSDGTKEGTEAVAAVGSSFPNKVVECNKKLFFVLGNTLWQSDGTKEGTHPVEDNIFSTITLNSYAELTAVDNQLFFAATTYKHGQELYSGYITKPGVVLYISAASGNWSDPATWAGNVVPPEGAAVLIRHNVTGNINTTCNELRIEEPGRLMLNPGINIRVLQ